MSTPDLASQIFRHINSITDIYANLEFQTNVYVLVPSSSGIFQSANLLSCPCFLPEPLVSSWHFSDLFHSFFPPFFRWPLIRTNCWTQTIPLIVGVDTNKVTPRDNWAEKIMYTTKNWYDDIKKMIMCHRLIKDWWSSKLMAMWVSSGCVNTLWAKISLCLQYQRFLPPLCSRKCGAISCRLTYHSFYYSAIMVKFIWSRLHLHSQQLRP